MSGIDIVFLRQTEHIFVSLEQASQIQETLFVMGFWQRTQTLLLFSKIAKVEHLEQNILPLVYTIKCKKKEDMEFIPCLL